VLETFTLTLFSTIPLLLGDIHVRLSKCVEYTCLKKINYEFRIIPKM